MTSIIICCYDEEPILKNSWSRLKQIDHLLDDIIFVNDGSTDNTQKILDEIADEKDSVIVMSYKQNMGYANINQFIPKGSRAISMSGFQGVLLAYDLDVCEWCPEEIEFGRNTFEWSAQEIYDWLKQHNYEYFIIDGRSIRCHRDLYGEETEKKFNKKIGELGESGLFNNVVFQNNGMIIVRVI